MCNIGELLHEWIQYFYKLKASENAAQDHSMYANEFDKLVIILYHNSVMCLLTQSKYTKLLPFKHIGSN